MSIKPFSQASENNKQPIAQTLGQYIGVPGALSVLEIGSGTGQHACYFCAQFPKISWQPTDVAENLQGIHLWVEEAGLENLKNPLPFDVNHPEGDEFFQHFMAQKLPAYSHIYTANTLHIMSWESVKNFFQWMPKLLKPQGLLFTYGPFKFSGDFTTESNARFDVYLKQKAPHQGVRDLEAIQTLAAEVGLKLKEQYDLPANNHLLVWESGPQIF